MKRILCIFIAALVFCSPAAFAATQEDLLDCAVANGSVAVVEYIDIVAPYSGTLESFDLEAGDTVAAGDVLFQMMTTSVIAPEEGTVSCVFGTAGERAENVLSRYGALVSMESEQQYRIVASTASAYNKDENKTLHVGETLYFRSNGSDKEEGEGRVISVSGSEYVVDILWGEFEQGETMMLYRDDDYENRDSVGKGTVVRRDPISVAGSGVIAQVNVEEGARVLPGDTLLTLMGADADPDASPLVTAQADGVVASVAVSAGQQVWKGQLLARVYCTDAREVVAQVDEVYLANIAVGDTISVTLDTDEETILSCTVTQISALGVPSQNAAYFTVHFALNGANDVLLGQSAKVYLPK